MSSYKFSPQQFICTKDPENMKDWVNRYGKSQTDDQGNVMTYTDYPELMKIANIEKNTAH